MDDSLIKKFVESYHEVDALVEGREYKKARKGYLALYEQFSAINTSDISEFDKEVAYDELHRLYSKIRLLGEEHTIPCTRLKVWHFVGVLLIIVILVNILVFVEPTGTGAAIVDGSSNSIPIKRVFYEPGHHIVYLDSIPSSLKLTGFVDGISQVFAIIGGEQVTIFDSSLVEQGSFTHECVDTCSFTFPSSSISLLINVESGELYLESMEYSD